MNNLKKTAITHDGVFAYKNTETVIGSVGRNDIVMAIDATHGEFNDKNFIIYADTNGNPIYLGYAYLDDSNEAHIDLSVGACNEDDDFDEKEIHEMIAEQMELAKRYQELGDTVHGTTRLAFDDDGYMTVRLDQQAYPDYRPENDDKHIMWRALALTATGKELEVFWLVEDYEDEEVNSWDFDIADDWREL